MKPRAWCPNSCVMYLIRRCQKCYLLRHELITAHLRPELPSRSNRKRPVSHSSNYVEETGWFPAHGLPILCMSKFRRVFKTNKYIWLHFMSAYYSIICKNPVIPAFVTVQWFGSFYSTLPASNFKYKLIFMFGNSGIFLHAIFCLLLGIIAYIIAFNIVR
jgi:hypothetical protein